jgi:hypothetical protein
MKHVKQQATAPLQGGLKPTPAEAGAEMRRNLREAVKRLADYPVSSVVYLFHQLLHCFTGMPLTRTVCG